MNNPAESYFYYKLLDRAHAIELARQTISKSIARLQENNDVAHPLAHFDGICSNPVQDEYLLKLRDGVRQIAHKHGYPKGGDKQSVTVFDYEVGNYLYEHMHMLPTQAADELVWNYFTLVLLPDVAKWRYPNRERNPEYYAWLGQSRRNVFRRAWWRSFTFGSDINAVLSDNECSAILDRTTFGGNPRIAQAIAKEHISRFSEYANNPLSRQDNLRGVMVHFGRWAEIIDFDTLNDEQLEQRVKEIFDSFLASVATAS
ncbi:hypothetical protein [Corynebacterium sp.]|uniref:hypothetical protein n=1 Tax=Corynebacterium sp. TaxID=1720 RepID=UPI0026DAE44A|nr:hypothetical protein [Corynebacterium sp.]MDO5076534.1 hypothetical protein [Corynebacterium sp.]